MQPRLERLVLHVQPRARLLGAQPLDVAQHDRHTVDLGQVLDCRHDGAAKLRAQ